MHPAGVHSVQMPHVSEDVVEYTRIRPAIRPFSTSLRMRLSFLHPMGHVKHLLLLIPIKYNVIML